MPNSPDTPLTYRAAGVDIDAGAALVERIKPAARATARRGVIGGLGGFGGLFELAATGCRDPVLVSSTDGVGTKLMLAIARNQHATIGIDLVAMCVNDVLVQGAEPLFFLDYFATGQLDVATAATVIEGVAAGCRAADCALLGGETAEMPGMYASGHYDLAGFCVGVVERAKMLDGSRIVPGDRILALASSGVHSNGYSLVRRILAHSGVAPDAPLAELVPDCDDARALADTLLVPTRIYVRALRAVLARFELHGLAHITGGGITDNLPRVLPDGTHAVIDLGAWRLPPVFRWLRAAGPVADEEMLRTFNCGVGMLVVVAAADCDAVAASLAAAGETVVEAGHVAAGAAPGRVIYRNELG
jgi:phosphoribosylformylglycinamidine cyclo-ligase